jgi:hypothetical protein
LAKHYIEVFNLLEEGKSMIEVSGAILDLIQDRAIVIRVTSSVLAVELDSE